VKSNKEKILASATDHRLFSSDGEVLEMPELSGWVQLKHITAVFLFPSRTALWKGCL